MRLLPRYLQRFRLFLPLIDDHDSVADRNIGRYGNHPPSFLSQAVHCRLSLPDAIDFNAVLVHKLSLPVLFRLLQPDHVKQASGSNKQQADDQDQC